MGQNNAMDRAIGVTSKVIDSMATGWTDEKHRLYLNAIEASFVKQLHSREHSSNDLLSWLSRAKIHTKLPRLDPKNQPIGQFKLKFERAAENDIESDGLSSDVAEVSDQNFADEVTRRCRKKRARNAVSPMTDQVVPFVVLASDEELSSKNLNKMENSLMIESQSSPSDDQQATDTSLDGR